MRVKYADLDYIFGSSSSWFGILDKTKKGEWRMKYLDGVVVNLTQVNRAVKRDKIFILQCDCLKNDNWYENGLNEVGQFPNAVLRCPECKMLPWMNGKREKVLDPIWINEDFYLPRGIRWTK